MGKCRVGTQFPMAITWLHISDLHVRDVDSYDRAVVFRALVAFVKRLREGGRRAPDLVFATGDIAYSGQADEYAIATDFFDQLLDAANLGRHELFAVPGNHDVDREVGRQLLRELPSRSAADEYFHPDKPKLHLTQKLGSFLQWHQSYFDGIRVMPENSTCGPVEVVEVRGERLGILPINTALFCQDDHDHERLFIGRRCLDTSLEELNRLGADLNIALMHHPLQDLSDLERSHIRAGLVDNLDVILSGHLHEEGYAAVDFGTQRNLWCKAGATYQTRVDWPNSAYYATFDTDHVKIHPIRYESQPRPVWTLNPSVFPYEEDHEMSFPVPRPPDFRSFRPLGSSRAKVPKPASLEPRSITPQGTAVLGIAALGFMESAARAKRIRKKKRKKKRAY